jgi:hypothetical protein
MLISKLLGDMHRQDLCVAESMLVESVGTAFGLEFV